MPKTILHSKLSRPGASRRLCGIVGSMALLAQGLGSSPNTAAAMDRMGGSAQSGLISKHHRTAPAAINANEYLLIHLMPSVAGIQIKASTLLFVPKGKVPAGGWRIIAWVHGTATWRDKARAPSLSTDLDGGLTRDGFTSNYVFMIASLVNAGYAVVAPDLEGLGPVANGAAPYYNAASSARSVVAGVRAARAGDPSLSNRWAVVGHSDGGRGALAVEAYAAEAPELDLAGTVALAPFTSIAASVRRFGELAEKDPGKADALIALQNFYVAGMATGLMAQNPGYDPSEVMGSELKTLMPGIGMDGSPSAIARVTKAVVARTPRGFQGFKPGWSETPSMAAFLAANDPAANPRFKPRLPTLILQGTDDGFVPEPLTAAFVARLVAAGAPVTYRTYVGSDHLSIVKTANSAMLTFLSSLMPSRVPH